MDAGMIVAFSAIGGNVILGIGLGITWLRNGKAQAVKYGELQNEVKNTGEEMAILISASNAIAKQVNNFETHCAGVSGRLDERLHAAERDIKGLRKP